MCKPLAALIASVEKSTKGRMRFKIRNAFLSKNPGRNCLAVNKASVTFCLILPVVSIDPFDPPLEVSSNKIVLPKGNVLNRFYDL